MIALYNGERFIKEALQSVFSQSVPPAEIVVVDDGSSDSGVEVVESLASSVPLRVVRTANGGQGAARNRGWSSTDADLIAFLDQDDVWYPTHLQVLREQFERHTGARPLGWAYSDVDELWADGSTVRHGMLRNFPGTHPKTSLAQCISTDMYILPSAALVARSALADVGGFDERLRGYEDDDLFLRILLAGYDNVFVDESLSKWRMHAGSSGRSPRMGQSRLIYLDKLVELCGTEAHDYRGNRLLQDLAVPRMLRSVGVELIDGLRSGDRESVARSIDQLNAIKPHASRRAQLAIGGIVPAVRTTPVGRLLVRVGAQRLARRAI